MVQDVQEEHLHRKLSSVTFKVDTFLWYNLRGYIILELFKTNSIYKKIYSEHRMYIN